MAIQLLGSFGEGSKGTRNAVLKRGEKRRKRKRKKRKRRKRRRKRRSKRMIKKLDDLWLFVSILFSLLSLTLRSTQCFYLR